MSSSTWNSSSTYPSTASSRRKHNLNEADTSDIVVYKVRHGTEITTQRKLSKELEADPTWRCSRVSIPRGCSRIDVKTRDLFNEPERTRYAEYPNANSSFASVGLPSKVYWRRLILDQFQELYILSPESSPASSTSGSVDVSNESSPAD